MLVCCGDALIDMIPHSGNGESLIKPVSGGAIFNTAIALGRLGVDVAMLTGLSTDRFGEQLAKDLRTSGVNTELCVWRDNPTTLAFVHLVNGQATYTFYDENTAGRLVGVSDLPPVPTQAIAFYFGGISLCSEPAADTYAALAEQQAGNATIVLDPNIRPSFISDEQLYRNRLQRLFAVSDVVKVSDEDLEWLFPRYDSERERVEYLRAEQMGGTANLVVVTRGSEGAQAYLPDGSTVYVPAKKASVVDTVGAGDTFNAGLLASLQAAGELKKSNISKMSADTAIAALELAAGVAAITVSREGANPPWASELTR